ncbi:MAG: hypothetical protein GY861_24410 [bacterium]|nr:hypothetical protein [bacterium]
MKFIRQVNIAFTGFETSDLRVNFEITKSLVGYPNLGLIKIYNLSESKRNQIDEQFSTLKLFAGYDDLVLLFTGDIVNVIHKYIQPDWITEIYAGDGIQVLNGSVVNKAMPAGSTVEQIYNELVDNMVGVTKGITEGLSDCITEKRSLLRQLQLTGNVKEWLIQLAADCGFDYAITDDIIETTVKNSPLTDLPPILINQGTGMIGSPERTDWGVTVKNLLLPELKLGRRFEIKAITTELNVGNLFFRKVPAVKNQGIYRIDKIIHTGDTHADVWQSEIHGRNF